MLVGGMHMLLELGASAAGGGSAARRAEQVLEPDDDAVNNISASNLHGCWQ